MADSKEYNVTVFERIASGGPDTVNAALDMLNTYGYAEPGDRRELKDALVEVALDKGEEALKKMANFHPDKDFILANVTMPTNQMPALLSSPSPVYANASGKHIPCMNPAHHNDCGCNKRYSDVGHTGTEIAPAAAADIASTNKISTSEMATLAIILLFAIGGLGIISMFVGQGFLHMKQKS